MTAERNSSNEPQQQQHYHDQRRRPSLNAMEDAMQKIERKRCSLNAMDGALKEIMALHRSLPSRPSIEMVEEAQEHIRQVDLALESRKREFEIQCQKTKPSASEDVRILLDILHSMRVETLEDAALQDKQKALAILQLEDRHRRYDGWIQQAHATLAPHFHGESPVRGENYPLFTENTVEAASKPSLTTEKHENMFSKDEKLSSKSLLASETNEERLPSEMKSSVEAHKHLPVPNLPSVSQSPCLTKSLSLSSMTGKGSENIGPQQPAKTAVSPTNPPVSAKLSFPDCCSGREHNSPAYNPVQDPSVLDVVFKNKDTILGPSKVSNFLDSVFKDDFKSLDLHGVFLKELEWVPESLGNLTWLTSLNLSGNQLEILPDSIGNLKQLTNLDVSANLLVSLPDTIGQLTSLEMLNIENNKIEELPWTIGQCVSLREIMADFNKLKALPEAIGNLSQLRSLSVHYNCLKSLPTSMATMKSLVKLDVHFNQLESISESLCLVTTLEYLNVGSNFTDLKELPTSIGRLQSLQHLDASFNHLTVLPDSFVMLTHLETLNLEGNPLKIPPLHVVEQGKDMVLKYMIEHVAAKEKEHSTVKRRKKNVLLRLGIMVLRYLKKQREKRNPDLQIRA